MDTEDGRGRVNYIKNEDILKRRNMEWCSKVEARVERKEEPICK